MNKRLLLLIGVVMLIVGSSYIVIVYGTDYGSTPVETITNWPESISQDTLAQCHEDSYVVLCYNTDNSHMLTYPHSTGTYLIRIYADGIADSGKITPIVSVKMRANDTLSFIFDEKARSFDNFRIVVLYTPILTYESIFAFLVTIGFFITVATGIIMVTGYVKQKRKSADAMQ